VSSPGPEPSTAVPRARRDIPGHIPLVLPPLIFLVVVFLIPLLILGGLSFLRHDAGLIINEFTLENYLKLFTDWFYLRIIYRTLAVSLIVGAFVTILSYPVAYFLTRTRSSVVTQKRLCT
jgi:putative spermidine/putrescine transport system permease protein